MNEDIERRADVKMIKVKGPDGKIVMKKAPRKEIEIGKGKLESTDAYAKALDRVRYRKQMSGISTSDKDKLGKVADMMKKERDKRKNTDPNHPSNKMKAAGFNEAADPSKYRAGSLPSQRGGHRPHLKNPHGKTSYLGGTTYKTASHAAGEAAAYHKGYFHSPGSNAHHLGPSASERGADKAVRAYREKNKQHLYTNEEYALDEAKGHPAAADLHAYAKKHGGIDKEYFQSAANHIAAGRHRELAMHVRNGDTEPRDHVLDTIHKHDKSLSDKIHKAAGFKRLREEDVQEISTDLANRVTKQRKQNAAGPAQHHQFDMFKKETDKERAQQKLKRNKELRYARGARRIAQGRPGYGARINDEVQVDEYITGKQIRMAKGIAFDKRHKGGDYTGAAKKMEKIKKGLSNHPAAKKALRQANESRLMSMQEVAGQRGRPKRGEDAASDSHIIMQLRSAQDLGGKKDIKFRGNRTAQVHPKHIDKILKYHDHPSLKPVDKRRLRVAISKSHDHLKRVADAIK